MHVSVRWIVATDSVEYKSCSSDLDREDAFGTGFPPPVLLMLLAHDGYYPIGRSQFRCCIAQTETYRPLRLKSVLP